LTASTIAHWSWPYWFARHWTACLRSTWRTTVSLSYDWPRRQLRSSNVAKCKVRSKNSHKTGWSIFHCCWTASSGQHLRDSELTHWNYASCWKCTRLAEYAVAACDCCFRRRYKCTYLLTYLLTYSGVACSMGPPCRAEMSLHCSLWTTHGPSGSQLWRSVQVLGSIYLTDLVSRLRFHMWMWRNQCYDRLRYL